MFSNHTPAPLGFSSRINRLVYLRNKVTTWVRLNIVRKPTVGFVTRHSHHQAGAEVHAHEELTFQSNVSGMKASAHKQGIGQHLASRKRPGAPAPTAAQLSFLSHLYAQSGRGR